MLNTCDTTSPACLGNYQILQDIILGAALREWGVGVEIVISVGRLDWLMITT